MLPWPFPGPQLVVLVAVITMLQIWTIRSETVTALLLPGSEPCSWQMLPNSKLEALMDFNLLLLQHDVF